MLYATLKKIIRYEFQLDTNEYLALDLSDEQSTSNEDTVFTLTFAPNLKTYMFCKRKIVQGYNSYTVEKIVTVTRDGDVHVFSDIEKFVDYIANRKDVTSITPY